MPLDEFLTEKDAYAYEVQEFVAVCRYTGRTASENLRMLCEDNPEPSDISHFTQIARSARLLLGELD